MMICFFYDNVNLISVTGCGIELSPDQHATLQQSKKSLFHVVESAVESGLKKFMKKEMEDKIEYKIKDKIGGKTYRRKIIVFY